MKKTFFSGKALIFYCLVVGMISFSSFVNATTYTFNWYSTSATGMAIVNANSDNLSSNYNGTIFTDGRNKWNASSANYYIYDVAYSDSDVDLRTVAASTWNDNGWGNGEAWTQLFVGDTVCNQYPAGSNPETNCANATVTYSQIFTNGGNVSTSSDRRRALIAHELGHVIGLAHTEFLTAKDHSIMTQNLAGGYLVTSYDVDEVNSKY
jgi:hypothetical protein